jgi:ABC-type polysaccharide/polyol phosphate transport system ATPase subunit
MRARQFPLALFPLFFPGKSADAFEWSTFASARSLTSSHISDSKSSFFGGQILLHAGAGESINPEINDSIKLSFVPATISVREPIYFSYPESWFGNIFSSVPKREFALENVTLDFQSSGVTILIGPSASGKSTLLHILAGEECPQKGKIDLLGGNALLSDDAGFIYPSKPVVIDRYYATEILTNGKYTLEKSVDTSFKALFPSRHDELSKNGILSFCKKELANHLGVDLDCCISDLTTSERYLARLVFACIESVLSPAPPMSNDDLSIHLMKVSAPILLMDELLDAETSEVARSVGRKLLSLCHQTGAIVVAATHKPEPLIPLASTKVTMVAGKVNMVEKLDSLVSCENSI